MCFGGGSERPGIMASNEDMGGTPVPIDGLALDEGGGRGDQPRENSVLSSKSPCDKPKGGGKSAPLKEDEGGSGNWPREWSDLEVAGESLKTGILMHVLRWIESFVNKLFNLFIDSGVTA